MKKVMKKDMKKNVKKNAQKCAQKAKIAMDQELVNEIKTYHRAHNRLVNNLIALSGNPTFVLATLHAVHAISMKYEQDTVCTLLRTRKAQKGE